MLGRQEVQVARGPNTDAPTSPSALPTVGPIPNGPIPTHLSNLHLDVAMSRECEKEAALDDDYSLKPQDVICSRRGTRDRCKHKGNIRFRAIVNARGVRYQRATDKKEKTAIVNEILSAVRESGGRFVRRDENNAWYDVGNARAREKVGHALRRAMSKVQSGATAPGSGGTSSSSSSVASGSHPAACNKKKAAAPGDAPVSSKSASASVGSEEDSLSSLSHMVAGAQDNMDLSPEPITFQESGTRQPPALDDFRDLIRSTFLSDMVCGTKYATEGDACRSSGCASPDGAHRNNNKPAQANSNDEHMSVEGAQDFLAQGA